MSKKRYINTVTFYTYGEDVTEALKEGLEICKEINDKHDAQADVEQVFRQPFGTLSSEEVDISKIKTDIKFNLLNKS